jgi:hypothetical protein
VAHGLRDGASVVIGIVSFKFVSAGIEGVQFTVPVFYAEALGVPCGPRAGPPHPVTGDPFLQGLVFGFQVQVTDEITLHAASSCEGWQGDCVGPRVSQVLQNSPAHAADLRVGDLLLTFDGMRFDRMGITRDAPWTAQPVQLTEVLHRAWEQRPYPLRVWRDGAARDLHPGIVGMPPLPTSTFFGYLVPHTPPPSFVVVDGLCLVTSCLDLLHEDVGQLLACKKPQDLFARTWVVVTNIMFGSRAQTKSSMRPSDIVEKVNGVDVKCVEDVMQVMQDTQHRDSREHGHVITLQNDRDVLFSTSLSMVHKWWAYMGELRFVPFQVSAGSFFTTTQTQSAKQAMAGGGNGGGGGGGGSRRASGIRIIPRSAVRRAVQVLQLGTPPVTRFEVCEAGGDSTLTVVSAPGLRCSVPSPGLRVGTRGWVVEEGVVTGGDSGDGMDRASMRRRVQSVLEDADRLLAAKGSWQNSTAGTIINKVTADRLAHALGLITHQALPPDMPAEALYAMLKKEAQQSLA